MSLNWVSVGSRPPQFSGGAKAHGSRDITGILERLEHPADDAAVAVNMAVEGGTDELAPLP